MNHIKVHDQIISRAKSRLKESGTYYEKHHIIPKCMGGLDSEDNLVNLTAREHFLVHWLLVEIYRETEYLGKLSHSWNMMCRISKGQESRKINSRHFSYAREERAKILRESNYDKEIIIFNNITRDIDYVGKLRYCGEYPGRVYRKLINKIPSVQGKYKFCNYYEKKFFHENEETIRSKEWDSNLENYQKGSKSECRSVKIILSKNNFIRETNLNDFNHSISRFHSQAIKGHTYKHGPLKDVSIKVIK